MKIAKVMKLADVIITFTGDRGVSNGKKFVRGLAHRRHDHDRLPVHSRLHNGSDALNRGGGLDRGSAELHYDHASSPSDWSSSALSTAAPAAPRIVLCPSATNFQSSTGHARRRPTNVAIPRSRSASLRGCGRSCSVIYCTGCF